jgi:hypothetical protein
MRMLPRGRLLAAHSGEQTAAERTLLKLADFVNEPAA